MASFGLPMFGFVHRANGLFSVPRMVRQCHRHVSVERGNAIMCLVEAEPMYSFSFHSTTANDAIFHEPLVSAICRECGLPTRLAGKVELQDDDRGYCTLATCLSARKMRSIPMRLFQAVLAATLRHNICK